MIESTPPMRSVVVLLVLGLPGLALPRAASAQCPPPGILWVEPDRPTVEFGTNLKVAVATTDAAPGGTVSGTITNDDTGDDHTVAWEVFEKDAGLPGGAADTDAVVHQAVHLGTPDPELAPDGHFTFDYAFTLAGGGDGGSGSISFRTGAGSDDAGPAVNGRFSVELAEVPAADSCDFGVDEYRFTFVGDDVHADGGDSTALQTTLFQVSIRDNDGVTMLDTGYYTNEGWSAVASRFDGRPDICFQITASDLYGHPEATNYSLDYCVCLRDCEGTDAGPEGDAAPVPGGFEASKGCFCGVMAAGQGRGGIALGVLILAVGVVRRR